MFPSTATIRHNALRHLPRCHKRQSLADNSPVSDEHKQEVLTSSHSARFTRS